MKRGFTLIEILLSIIILSILFLAMGNILSQMKFAKKESEHLSKKFMVQNSLAKVLYYDLLNATDIKIVPSESRDYCRVFLKTNNSLYNLIEPYVVWYVSKKKNSLIRIESYKKVELPSQDLFYLDRFAERVKIFRIYQKDSKYFVYIDNGRPVFFEMLK